MAQIQTKNDPVNHPNHYNWVPGIEAIEVVENFNFNLGCAIKYIWRSPMREIMNSKQDLRKAIFCLERELDRLEVKIEAARLDSWDKEEHA